MIPSQTMIDFPVFSDTGTKVKPDDDKYAAGFIPDDVLPAQWLNYFLNKASAGVTTLNSGVSSLEAEINSVLADYNITADQSETSQLLTALKKIYPQFTECLTAANEEVKSIAVTGNVLKAGNVYVITMTNGNTYGDGATTYPKLSINSGTAYPMCDSSGHYLKSGAWAAGDVVNIMFTGSVFLMATNVTDTVASGNMNAVTSNAVQISLNNYVPVGVVFPYTGSNAPAGFLLCNGATLNISDYPALYSVIGTKYGGDGTTTFKVPNYAGKFLEGKTSSGSVGDSVSAGLPNITGKIDGVFFGKSDNQTANATNAFVNTSVSTGGTIAYGTSYYTLRQNVGIDFNASKSNTIYGNSNTVQPPAMLVNYIIKY